MSLFLKRIPVQLRWIISLALLLLLILFLYRLVFYMRFKPTDAVFSGRAFILGLRYDLRIAGIFSLGILLLSSFPPWNPFKNRGAFVIWKTLIPVLFLITFIFCGADYYHYDYLRQRLNASVLNYLNDAAISAKMMWQTYPLIKILILFAGLFLLLFQLNRFWLERTITEYTIDSRRKPIHFLVFFLLMSLAIFGRLSQYPLRWSDAFNFADDFKSNVALNPFQSFFSSLKFRKNTYVPEKVKAGYKLMAATLGIPDSLQTPLNFARPNLTVAKPNQPNIILVICESFSAYKSSMYGNPLNTTPYFNEMSKQGLFFERCFTPAYGTARGVWATLTGIPDVEPAGTTASRNPNAVNQNLLINHFKGYEKYYFLGGSASWANIRGLLTNNIEGLHLYEEDQFKAQKVDVWGISDKNLMLEANNVLKKEQKPFFAIIQTADNHRPYTIPEEDRGRFKMQQYAPDTLRKYGFESNEELNAFRYTDFCFQQFMETAKKERYFENTLFVFIGDHGIRGNAGDMFPRCWTEQGLTCEHVPLLFYAPAFVPAQRMSGVCSQTDVMPTIASLSNIRVTNRTLGRSLIDTTPGYAFIIDPDINSIGLINDRYYYVQHMSSGKEHIFSITNNDPVPDTITSRRLLSQLAEAYFHTSKYLLLNNRK